MTDEDYIRKAVELADGWENKPFGDQPEMVSSLSLSGEPLWNLSQEYKDALAAQLVRQCQNAGYQVLVNNHWSGKVGVSIYNTTNKGVYCEHFQDTSVYKAIVDSKVLECE